MNMTSQRNGDVPETEPTLDGFFEQVRTHNPFLANRADCPLLQDAIDVFGIHESEFRRILNLGQQAHQEQRGIGVVVWGEAGSGKTHLLARIGRWARERQKAQFFYLHHIHAGADQVPRCLLHGILGIPGDGRSPYFRSPLFALINAALRVQIQSSGLGRGNWDQVEQLFEEMVDRIASRTCSPALFFNRTIYKVLFFFYRAAFPAQQGKGDYHAGLALRWLSGESLNQEEVECLGLAREPDAANLTPTSEKQHVLQVFAALTELARSANQLFLLCLDQVDNLEQEQLKALSRFLHDLLDSTANLLVVTAGVRETLLDLLKKGVIPETAWDRIGQMQISLGRISRARGRELLWSRLQRFLACARGLKPIEASISQDALFPLEAAWFEECFGHLAHIRPRDLLALAARRWQQHQETLTTTPGPLWLARLKTEMARKHNSNEQKATVVDRTADTQLDRQKEPLPRPAATSAVEKR